MKDFDSWNNLKKEIQNTEQSRFFKEGEIWWTRIGINIGHEADGKGEKYQRPVLIIKKYNKFSFLGIPLTTSPKMNPYGISLGSIDGKQVSLNASQIKYTDSRRITERMSVLSKEVFELVKQKASQLSFG